MLLYNVLTTRHIISLLVALVFMGNLHAQTKEKKNAYGVHVRKDLKQFTKEIKSNPEQALIDLKSLIPDLQLDLRYADTNNFVSRQMYPGKIPTTYLRLHPATALQRAATVFREQGYGIRIFDAYRPYSVTIEFWERVRDERYVANPRKGSGHNRGLSVDLTLYDLKTGQELNMGTVFDNFTDSAHHTFKQFSELILNNRKLLKETMEANGFTALSTEWWHYSWPNNKNYELLDFTFRQINRLNR